MRLLQSHLPLPQAKTRYEWRPLRPGSPPRECEILIFGGQIRSWRACTIIWLRLSFLDQAVLGSEFSLVCFVQLMSAALIAHVCSPHRHRSCVLHRFVKDECTVLDS